MSATHGYEYKGVTDEELLSRQELTVSCLWCSWTATGNALTVMKRARRHRESRHGSKAQKAGRCRRHTCSNPGVHEMHRGEWLCEKHHAEHLANVATRRKGAVSPDARIRRTQARQEVALGYRRGEK